MARNKLRPIVLARTVLLFFSFLILAGSSVPGHKIPEAFQLTPDKLIHCAEYFFLGSAIFYWLSQEFSIQGNYKLILMTLLIGSAFGMLDENYQRLTPSREIILSIEEVPIKRPCKALQGLLIGLNT